MTPGEKSRELSADQVARRREWFREHWATGIPFAVLCGFLIDEWSPERVRILMPLRPDLSAHEGMFHGGAVATLIDTAGCGAVIAGHDFSGGGQISTVSMTVNYVGTARGEDAMATARCVRRGTRINFAEVDVTSVATERLLAKAVLTLSVSGRPAGTRDR